MKVISLFSGIGGFELAADAVGWEVLASCEINPFGRRVLEYYWPESYLHDDVHTLTYEKLDHELTKRFGPEWRSDDIVLVGGFPCQPYSLAGKRKGKDDSRHLWPEMLRIIREIQPTWVVGENVYGLVNWNEGLVFEEVSADLENEGYEVQPYILPAVSVGAVHRRDRVWFVAYANGNPKGTPRQSTGTTGNRSNIYVQQSERGSKTELNIRSSAIPRNAAHPNGNGFNQRNGNDEKQPSEGRLDAQRYTLPGNGDGDAADTESQQSKRMRPEQREFGKQKQGELGGNGGAMGDSGDAADTNGIGLRRESDWFGESRFINETGEIGNWQNFPTQSPICGGDDGLPTKLDGITFSKWRNESIKAYGNAVVPQVVIALFNTINEYNKTTSSF